MNLLRADIAAEGRKKRFFYFLPLRCPPATKHPELLLEEDFDLVRFHDEVGEFAFKTGGAHDVVVDPVVIAAPRFAEQDAVVFEIVEGQPFFGYFPVRFGATGKEKDDMTFVVPAVEHGQRIGIRQHGAHAFGFFIGHIVADGAVYVDEEIFDVLRQYGADAFAFFVKRLLQPLLRDFCIRHGVKFTQR
jgi:hypothetical protein